MNISEAAAIRYFKGDKAPVLLCKGRNQLAERLKKEAEALGIPLVQDEELLRGVLELAPMEYIPEEMYMVVAEILSFVYAQGNGKQE